MILDLRGMIQDCSSSEELDLAILMTPETDTDLVAVDGATSPP